MSNVILYRSRSAWFSAGVTTIIVLALVIQTFAAGSIKADLVASAWGIFVISTSYLLFIHPKIEIFDEGIRITNPIQRITVGWDRVEEIEARYTMSIHVAGKRIYAWAAPAPGRYHARSIHPSEVKGMDLGVGGEIRPGESPRSESGQASYIAKLRWRNFEALGIEGCESAVLFNFLGAAITIGSLASALIFYALSF